jgi:protein-tyrosine phosphatase
MPLIIDPMFDLDQITERIFIGSSECQPQAEIGAVLNVAMDLERHLDNRLEYAKVGLIDGPGNCPTTLMAAIFMLHQLLERHNRVVIHCHAGVSRSPLVVALYLAARSEKMTVEDALRLVKSKRNVTDPAPALIELACKLLPDLRKLLR